MDALEQRFGHCWEADRLALEVSLDICFSSSSFSIVLQSEAGAGSAGWKERTEKTGTMADPMHDCCLGFVESSGKGACKCGRGLVVLFLQVKLTADKQRETYFYILPTAS